MATRLTGNTLNIIPKTVCKIIGKKKRKAVSYELTAYYIYQMYSNPSARRTNSSMTLNDLLLYLMSEVVMKYQSRF